MALRNFGLLEASAQLTNASAAVATEGANLSMFGYAVDRMTSMYDHVSQFGIDKTFLRLYNSHNELDRAIGMQFPSCEDMDVIGSPYDRTSTAFMVAMEDEGEGIWAKIKALFAKIWNWIKEKVSAVYNWVKKLFGSTDAKVDQLEKQIQENPNGQAEVPAEIAKDPTFLQSVGGQIKTIGGSMLRGIGGFFTSKWAALAASKEKLAGYFRDRSEANRLYKEALQTIEKLAKVKAAANADKAEIERLTKLIRQAEMLKDRAIAEYDNLADLQRNVFKKGKGDTIIKAMSDTTGHHEERNLYKASPKDRSKIVIDNKRLDKYLKDKKKELENRKKAAVLLESYKNDTLKGSPKLNAILDLLKQVNKTAKGLDGTRTDKNLPEDLRKELLSKAHQLAMLDKALIENDAKLSAALGDSVAARVISRIKIFGKNKFGNAAGTQGKLANAWYNLAHRAVGKGVWGTQSV